MGPPRGWWRSHFTDHPLYILTQKPQERPPIVWANASGDKIKIYCTGCLNAEVQIISNREAADSTANRREPREIELSLFNVAANVPHKWIEARADTAVNHLRYCMRNSATVRDRAQYCHEVGDMNADPANATPRRANRTMQSAQVIHSPQPLRINTTHYGDIHPTYSASPISADPFMSTPAFFPSQSPGIAPIVAQYSQVVPSRIEGPSPAPTPISSSSRSHTGSPAPGYHLSIHGSQKRGRTSAGLKRSASAARLDLTEPWTRERQEKFERAVGRLTASASFPLSWVQNPEFIEFCNEFIPGAKVPSRKVLTKRIIPAALKEIRAENIQIAAGGRATVQSDGWTGENHRHLLAFMITTKRTVFTVRVEDTSVDLKTADNLLAHMLDVLHVLDTVWKVKVVAFTTDASGESLKARRLLRQKRPDLVTPNCYAHQINLIVGDYFKADAIYLKAASDANELITWLRGKTAILGLIAQVLRDRGQRELSVVRPVPTRWTAFFLAYRRLLQLRQVLEFIIVVDEGKPESERQLVRGDSKAKDKAKRMIKIMKDPLFWNGLVRIKHHLEPLAIAANVTQAAHCRLDQALLTFGALFNKYSKIMAAYPNEDAATCTAVLKSIERRWLQSDREVFIAAVILNPFIKVAPFQEKPTLISVAAVHALFSKLWQRFFDSVPPTELHTNVRQYLRIGTSQLDGDDTFAQLDVSVTSLAGRAAREKKSPDPLSAYEDLFVVGGDGHSSEQHLPPLVLLALHVLAICPNSASCERLFSQFGLILTKLRARLQKKQLVNLAEYKLHIRDHHLRTEAQKLMRKRHFGILSQPVLPDAASTTPITPVAPAIEDVEMADATPITTLNEASEGENVAAPDDIANSAVNNTLSAMTSTLVSLVDEDADNDGDSESDSNDESEGGSHARDTRYVWTIEKLFDFSRPYWKNESHLMSAIGSLDDEMEFYDLLSMDAIGEMEADLDETVASIFQPS